jgi:hypothetical protein
VNPKVFYAFDALKGEVLTSADGGAHFEVTATNLRAVPEYELQYASIKTVPGREGEVWVTTKMELSRSSNSGKSFRAPRQGAGGPRRRVRAGGAGQGLPAVYLSGKVQGGFGFFRSDDGGETFVRINDDAHQYGGATVLTGDPRVYGRVYARLEAGASSTGSQRGSGGGADAGLPALLDVRRLVHPAGVVAKLAGGPRRGSPLPVAPSSPLSAS